MSQIPVTLDVVLSDLQKSEARAAALVRGGSASQLNWQPEGRRWSVLQCLQHLALANEVLGSWMEHAVEGATSGGPGNDRPVPNLLWRTLLAAVEPPGLKGYAPKRLQPPSLLDAESTLASLLRTHDQLRSLAGRCAGLDLNRIKYRHPFVHLKISVATTFLLITAHERRHLWQGERVAAGFEVAS
jgi:hypothetical protein